MMLVKNNRTGDCYWRGEEITQERYDEIRAMIANKPVAPDGYGYRLTDGLEWELYELPPEDPDPDLTAEEALDTILGGVL